MKLMRLAALSVVALAGMLKARGQTWTQTAAPNANWAGIAMSADGTKLVAVTAPAPGGLVGDSIFTSTNSGATWISNDAPKLTWVAVCSSADGRNLAANASGRGGTWTNSGTSWKQSSCPLAYFYPSSIASSADGNTVLAAGNPLYMSTNRGVTWTSPTNAYEGCAISADASRMLALTLNPYFSTNSGITWALGTNIQTELRAAAMSVDGVNLFAMGDAGVWVSTNGGSLWFKGTNSPQSSYGSIASSADGTRLIVARHSTASPIYLSTNSGVTWFKAGAPSNYWSCVTASADGNTFAAAVNGGGIWIWQKTPSPSLMANLTDGLQLSWLVPSTNFVLQQSSDLANWSDVTNRPALNLTNLQYQVTLPLAAGNCFYRLKTP